MPPNLEESRSVLESSLLSTDHGRERREERNINKVDLQTARRYGMQEDASRPGGGKGRSRQRIKYTYGGVTFIYDPIRNCEVTSYASRDISSDVSGTKVHIPALLPYKESYRTATQRSLYSKTRLKVLSERQKWTSHTVLVVDMSGSMRRDDVNGARCRSDGVWIALARDFVQKQLLSKSATEYDMVSVVLMNETAETAFMCFPMGWPLYNQFVSMREWKNVRPKGPGHYLPALVKAEALLDINPSGACSLSLMFFSDGVPSDQGPFAERMGNIASKFGRRLTVTCIGMGSPGEEFNVLQQMADEAKQYGSISSFNQPSLSTESLSNIMSSLVTSLTSSKTELTECIQTGTMRSVRVDIRRERKGAPDDTRISDDWHVFHNQDSKKYVPYIWTWSYRNNDFVTLMDPRCINCYECVADDDLEAQPTRGIKCPKCKACFICRYCCQTTDRMGRVQANALMEHVRSEDCDKCRDDRRRGKIIKKAVPSFALAVKKLVFGEGAERIVYKVRFVDERLNFTGPKMVAKESRFVEARGSYDDRMNYHRDFLRTQSIASEFAKKFNDALDGLKKVFHPSCHRAIDRLPRIRFLQPLVVEALGVNDDGKEWNILVEEQLEGEYTKFNSNRGYVHDQAKSKNDNGIDNYGNANLSSDDEHDDAVAGGGLGVILEGDEDEEDEDDDDEYDDNADQGRESNHIPTEEEVFDTSTYTPDLSKVSDFSISEEQIPQAFSHFTYEKSKKMLMVVDLQGVLERNDDGTRTYVLTDPAIHKRRKKKRSQKLANWTFGRTDRGESGMHHFFKTHVCNDTCRLLGLSEHKRRQEEKESEWEKLLRDFSGL